MDSMVAAAVVAASVVIVVIVIAVMSRSRSRRLQSKQASRTQVETERREVTRLERRALLENQRQQPKPKMAEEHLIPSLDEQLNEQPEEPQPSAPVSPSTKAGVTSPYPEEAPAGSSLAKKVEIPVEEDEAEFAEETAKGKADAGLSAFMIEVSEDDGLSKLAESLEDIDVGDLTELARDILTKGAK